MEASHSYKMLVSIYHTTQYYIPEDHNLHILSETISDPTYIINVLKFNVSQYTLYFIGPLSLPRSSQSPGEPRNKRLRRLSSTEEEMDLGAGRDKGTGEVTYYGQSPASLSSQTSWHSDVDHGGLGTLTFLSLVILINICTYKFFLLWFHLCTSSYTVENNIQIMLFSTRFWIICSPQGFFLFHYSLFISLFHCYFSYLFIPCLFLSVFLSAYIYFIFILFSFHASDWISWTSFHLYSSKLKSKGLSELLSESCVSYWPFL